MYMQKHKEQIVSKLKSEGLDILSDLSEIEAVLNKCVMKTKLIIIAKSMRL